MSHNEEEATLDSFEVEDEFADMQDELATEPALEEHYGVDEVEDFDLEHAAEELLSDDEDDEEEQGAALSRGRDYRARSFDGPESAPAAGMPLVAAGVVTMLVGFGLSLGASFEWAPATRIAQGLTATGLTPGLLLVMGVIVSLVASVRRQQNSGQSRIATLEAMVADNEQYTSQALDYLVGMQEQQDARRPASGEELDQVLHTLSQQGAKITNITKALKMYGKPLVEVNKQLTELDIKTKAVAAGVADMRPRVTELQENLQPAVERLEPTIRSVGESVNEDLQQSIRDVATSRNRELLSAIEELRCTTAADATKVHDLLAGLDLGQLLESVEQLGASLTSELTKNLTDRDGAMDTTLFDGIQSQLDELRRSVGELPSAVRSLIPVAATASAPVAAATPAPAPTAPAPSSTLPEQGSGDAPGGLAHSISGENKSQGKNVLGAIAKLRRMRPNG